MSSFSTTDPAAIIVCSRPEGGQPKSRTHSSRICTTITSWISPGCSSHGGTAVLAGSLVYSGDTGPSPALEQLAQGCDLLIHMCSYITGTVDNRATQLGTSGHLEAARAAAAAGARRLVTTHIYEQFDQPGIREKVV